MLHNNSPYWASSDSRAEEGEWPLEISESIAALRLVPELRYYHTYSHVFTAPPDAVEPADDRGSALYLQPQLDYREWKLAGDCCADCRSLSTFSAAKSPGRVLNRRDTVCIDAYFESPWLHTQVQGKQTHSIAQTSDRPP